MWPFSRASAPLASPGPGLEERVAALERENKALRADMDEWIDRVSRLLGRISKRAALDHPPHPPVDPGASETVEDINTRIKRQRAGIRLNGN